MGKDEMAGLEMPTVGLDLASAAGSRSSEVTVVNPMMLLASPHTASRLRASESIADLLLESGLDARASGIAPTQCEHQLSDSAKPYMAPTHRPHVAQPLWGAPPREKPHVTILDTRSCFFLRGVM